MLIYERVGLAVAPIQLRMEVEIHELRHLYELGSGQRGHDGGHVYLFRCTDSCFGLVCSSLYPHLSADSYRSFLHKVARFYADVLAAETAAITVGKFAAGNGPLGRVTEWSERGRHG